SNCTTAALVGEFTPAGSKHPCVNVEAASGGPSTRAGGPITSPMGPMLNTVAGHVAVAKKKLAADPAGGDSISVPSSADGVTVNSAVTVRGCEPSPLSTSQST